MVKFLGLVKFNCAIAQVLLVHNYNVVMGRIVL